MTASQLSAAQQTQMDNRDSTGQWKAKTHGGVEDTSGVLGIDDPGVEDSASDLRAGVAGAMKEDMRQSYNDGAFSEDGEPPAIEADELTITRDASSRLDAMTDDFVSDHHADLKRFSEITDQDMVDAGADAYLSGSGSGVGFTDRVDSRNEDHAHLAARLDDAAAEHFQTAFENVEITDDGEIDF